MEKIGNWIFVGSFRFNIKHLSIYNAIEQNRTRLTFASGSYAIDVPFEEFDSFMMSIINKQVGL